MDMTPYLKLMAEKGASDLFFCTGTMPHLKIEGTLRPVGNQSFGPGDVEKLGHSIMNDAQVKEFEKELELNFAVPVADVGRFRVNVFRQRGEMSIVIRFVQTQIPKIEEMNLPLSLEKIIMEKRGLILVVGATGSGKSTSLAAMIGHRNRNSGCHILTIEDPIEFIHTHEKSVVQQREVGLDTLSYENALKNALREAPDVILIGEIRDMDTMKHAINYSETGHLCLATLHANNANQALDRIINFFPETAHRQLLTDLSLNLRSIISQRLLPGVNGKLVPAVEVLLNTPYIAELILKGNVGDIKDAMKDSTEDDSITFDQALLVLYSQGTITLEEALKNADSKNDLSLAIRMESEHDHDDDSELILG
ncbi:MAG: type IV pili twitching motility protein PilT [Gammaproteobacteria bacterium]|nr:MAG: type IV pili twitching motility protein PilT [Gammaproteobacteria bacterium]RKZ98763.1 MAG: type IV pili twitching motility protein PilT [Gammaproteobacteria bacterium]RLA02560.1 MAG: type IV pili twitching motility protein PilT [Gammaproteobacteria bacterium]